MGAIIMCSFVILIAIIGFVYYYIRDNRELKIQNELQKHTDNLFSVTEGKHIVIDNEKTTIYY